MAGLRTFTGISNNQVVKCLIITLLFSLMACNGKSPALKGDQSQPLTSETTTESVTAERFKIGYVMLVLPENPKPGEEFRILTTGGKAILKAQIVVTGQSGSLKSLKSKNGNELPFWRIDDFQGNTAGKYTAEVIVNKITVSKLDFMIAPEETPAKTGVIWKTRRGWDSDMETLYSAWINALFYGFDEQATWSALHEVTRNREQNFLFNHLSIGEDNPEGKNTVQMQPDCADNPSFLRAYFSWKLGLPFGYHICDRGYVGRKPRTGKWVTNESAGTKTDRVAEFNNFLRKLKDGVHSGTARTALDDESSDYYPVPLEPGTIQPGTVYADPYGHTLIMVSLKAQTRNHPGLLLSVDAQPDGTVGIKRFWKGNFLFNTSGVIGEPGFKAFRPIILSKGIPILMKNVELTRKAGFVPYSLQQRNMETGVFYQTIARLINPEPLDPETELQGLIQALHEQLIVRVTSVANGEAYFKSNPGSVIPMPSGAAGIFLAGGQWENFSTPNRDLRLLIAMDEVLNYPDINKYKAIFDQKASELSVTYTRSDGSLQKLTIAEILKRRDAFEMAYNPNDGPEIRWGAPEKSDEILTCRRRAPASQLEKMRSVRAWFSKRLHPPT
jgi:hypothetical protein